MDEDDLPVAAKRNWVPNKPEQRFSIAIDRLLNRTLLPPRYFSAIHDADGTKRTDQQRMRDKNRGVKSGQLDVDVWQGSPFVARKLELKRGKGVLSENQKQTIADLTACGAPPVVAWDLMQAYRGLVEAGFRFSGNARNVVAELEQHLAAWDREAEGILAGTIVKKKSSPRKPPPRFTMGKRAVARARRGGIML